MFSYPLRAKSIDDKTLFTFTVRDGICRISSTEFILMNIDFSPILQLNSVLLGNEDGTYFENDIIQSEDKMYRTIYQAGGFTFVQGDESKIWSELVNPIVLGATEIQPPPMNEKRRLMYNYEGKVVSFNLFRGSINEYPITDSLGWYAMKPENIKQTTYIPKGNNKYYFFGDSIDGEVIEMINGRVMLGKNELLEILKDINLEVK